MDVVMPQLGETVKEGTVIAWRKKAGERVEKDEPLFEVNTDKVDMDVPSPATGVVSAILVAEGATVRVGAKLAVIQEEGKTESADPASKEEAPPPAVARSGQREAVARDPDARLSPVVRKLLAEHGLEAAAIQGTAPGGPTPRDDLLAHLPPPGTAPG